MSFWEKVSSFFARKTVEKADQVSNKVTSVSKTKARRCKEAVALKL
jgi:hypothetical protein